VKAIVCRSYGPPEALRLEDVAIPAAGPNEVLIRVRAASVNQIDKLIRGRPYVTRAMTGWARPKDARVGCDLAGEVEAVGRDVTRFRAGDQVFGTGRGAFAEYATVSEDRLAVKPPGVTFEEAASTPVAAITALQALRDRASLRPGQEILINGAAGGVGTFAVQLARMFGARVTAVCSSGNTGLVESLGAAAVVDYSKADFTRLPPKFDVVLDCVGNRSLRACCRVLHPSGTYLAVGTPSLTHLLAVKMASPLVRQKVVVFMARIRSEDLRMLADLLRSRAIVPVVGDRFSLGDTPAAIRRLETGHARGKLVIEIDV